MEGNPKARKVPAQERLPGARHFWGGGGSLFQHRCVLAFVVRAASAGKARQSAKARQCHSPLASFTIATGTFPFGSLVEDASGDLFGTTEAGGAANDGTVFELQKGSSSITTLASFTGSNGAKPYAGLVMDSSGNLFGTTYYGGSGWTGSANSGYGTVFAIVHGTASITTLASFNGSNGAYPFAGLVEDSSGDVFGTTSGGGAFSDGTVFEVIKGNGSITTLATCTANNDMPEGTLLEDGSGNLFGTTYYGGLAGGFGSVFEVQQGAGTITTPRVVQFKEWE